MGDRNNLQSPIKRARMAVDVWMELLPKEAKLDAEMALDKFCQVAEREIEQAYFDGHNQRHASATMRKISDAAPAAS